MNHVIRISYLLLILSIASGINCGIVEVENLEFSMIFGAGKQIVLLRSHEDPQKASELWKNHNN